MKNLFLTVALVATMASTACIKVETGAEEAAETIAGAVDSFGTTLEEILAGHQQGSQDSADADSDDTADTVDGTGMAFVASYKQVAQTCHSRYGFPKNIKLFADLDGTKLGDDVIITDLAGDWTVEGVVDQDTQTILIDVVGSSQLDVAECECDVSAVGLNCGCDTQSGRCAVVYDVK